MGVTVWLDEAEIRIGDSLTRKIEEGIAGSDYLGAVISADSVASEWVQREVRMAMTAEITSGGVKVLPLLIHDIEIPGFMKDKLYADFRSPDHYWTSIKLLADRLGVALPETEPPEDLRVLLDEGLDHLEGVYDFGHGVGKDSITTGFGNLDNISRGFPKRAVSLVGAEDQCGKSALLFGSSLAAAREEKFVLLYATRFARNELFQRLLAIEAKIDLRRLISANLTESDWARISKAMSRMGEDRLSFVTARRPDLSEIEHHLRTGAVRDTAVELLLIDDGLPDPADSAPYVSGLADLARKFDCAIVLSTSSLQVNEEGWPVIQQIRPYELVDLLAQIWFIRPVEGHSGPFEGHETSLVEVGLPRHRNGPNTLTELLLVDDFGCLVDAPLRLPMTYHFLPPSYPPT